jgi:hypothetical protein
MNGARKELLMEAVSTRARFGDLAPGAETRRIEATVSRREIEEVLRAEGQPELLLDVRLSGDGRAETRRVAVEWERADLEKLLKDARAERVNLGIDIDSLIRALEGPEVEAHGLREKALVLTVALVAAAPGAAGGAVDASGGGGAEAIPAAYSAVEETRHGPGTPETIPAGYSAVEETREAPGGAPAEAIPAGYSAVEETREAPGGVPAEAIPAGFSAVEETRWAPAGGPETIPVSFTAVEETRGKDVGGPEPVSGDGGVSVSAPGLAEALGIAGAVSIAIAGAAFALRARRRELPT